MSHVMQWGDASFVGDSVSSFIGGGKSNNFINLRKRLPSFKPSIYFDSRLMKIKILAEVHKREKTSESEKEMRQ